MQKGAIHDERTGVNKVPTWERLYKKGLIVAAEQQLRHEEAKKEAQLRQQQDEEGHELTFHPRINLTSSSITSEAWKLDPVEACDRLYDLGKRQLEERQRQEQLRLENEMRRIALEREEVRRYVRGSIEISPPRTEEDREALFSRLCKPSFHTTSLRHPPGVQAAPQKKLSSKDLPHERLYLLSKTRDKLQVMQEQEVKQSLEHQSQKALEVMKARGGPSCVSGVVANCQCPDHHHGTQRSVSSEKHLKPKASVVRAKAAPSASLREIPPKATRDAVASEATRTTRPAAVRHVSDRLLTVPSHRRYQDPNSSAASAAANDSLFASLSAVQNHRVALHEPPPSRLSLDELARHELLARSRSGYSP